MARKITYILALAALLAAGCSASAQKNAASDGYVRMAQQALDSLYACYSVPGTELLRENYPFDSGYRASYVSEQEQRRQNPYSFLWPYSGTLSAAVALLEATGDQQYRTLLDERVLPGLERYLDTRRDPPAYASYVRRSDRYYDDNVWVGIDFTDLYMLTGERAYLEKAEMVWKFIESGTDTLLGGGIYWCEQTRSTKNTCSNAPGAVYALKLYNATGIGEYLEKAGALYAWTKKNLRDPSDDLYWDNISLDGKIDRRKFAYNSGQMMQAAVLIYKETGEAAYLEDAQRTAASAYDYFFQELTPDEGKPFRILKRGSLWFSAVMFRGFVELYHVDGNGEYMDAFRRTLDYGWEHARDERGLVSTDWSGQREDRRKWLLTQAAAVEMYARMAAAVPAGTTERR